MELNPNDLNQTKTLTLESLEDANPSRAYASAFTSNTYEVLDGEPSPYVIASRPVQP